MSTLLVDIGNSRFKWARWQQRKLSVEGRLPWRAETLDRLLTRLWTDDPNPQRILVSNVAGEETAATLCNWCQAHWSIQPWFASVDTPGCGIRNGYLQPHQLGVDRWLALVAAWKQYHDAVIVVDCGTAVTIDVLGNNGQHLGGIIFPGAELMRRALSSHTHALEVPKTESASQLLGTNTDDGIASGSYNAVVGGIERLVKTLREQQHRQALPCVIPCVITGGDAAEVCAALRIPYDIEPDLVFYGLTIVSELKP